MSSSIDIQNTAANGTKDCIRRMLEQIKADARALKKQTHQNRRLTREISRCSLRERGRSDEQRK